MEVVYSLNEARQQFADGAVKVLCENKYYEEVVCESIDEAEEFYEDEE